MINVTALVVHQVEQLHHSYWRQASACYIKLTSWYETSHIQVVHMAQKKPFNNDLWAFSNTWYNPLLQCFNDTHQTFFGGPVDLIVDADARLVCLQGIREAADLQDQQVHGIQDFLAVHHSVSQTLQLSVAHRAWQSTGEAAGWRVWELSLILFLGACTNLAIVFNIL